MSSSWQQGEGNWSVLPSKECACEGGGRGGVGGGGGGDLGFAKAGAIWVKEEVWGAFHSSAQTQKKKKKCVVEILTVNRAQLLQCSLPHLILFFLLLLLLHDPPKRHAKVAHLHVCLFACFCLRVVVVRWFSQACEAAATGVAARRLLTEET